MGMTIDEAINYLIALKHCETCEANDTNICKTCSGYRRGSSAKCYDAIDVGVDTMRKHQVIEQIIDRVHHTGLEPSKAYELIQEVAENGNDD